MAGFIALDSIAEHVAIALYSLTISEIKVFSALLKRLPMYKFVVGSIDGVGKHGGRVTRASGEGGFRCRRECWQLKAGEWQNVAETQVH